MAVEAIIISSDAAYIGIGKPTKYLYVCNGKIPGTCATLYIFYETRIEQSLYGILMVQWLWVYKLWSWLPCLAIYIHPCTCVLKYIASYV